MVEDLLRDKRLVGLGIEEVKNLLGEPDEAYNWGNDKSERWLVKAATYTMSWEVNQFCYPPVWKGYIMYLRLWFDENGTCVEADISDF